MTAPHRAAAQRSWRTIRQGAIAAAVLAGAGAASEWLKAGDFNWTALGVSVGTASVMAGLAYLERAYVDPRRGRKPLDS